MTGQSGKAVLTGLSGKAVLTGLSGYALQTGQSGKALLTGQRTNLPLRRDGFRPRGMSTTGIFQRFLSSGFF